MGIRGGYLVLEHTKPHFKSEFRRKIFACVRNEALGAPFVCKIPLLARARDERVSCIQGHPAIFHITHTLLEKNM